MEDCCDRKIIALRAWAARGLIHIFHIHTTSLVKEIGVRSAFHQPKERNMHTAQQAVSKSIKKVLGITTLLMLIPAVGQLFSREISWGPEDFVLAAMLLAGTGIAYVLAARRLQTPGLRMLAGSALGAALLLVWAELAVGIFS
jgi:hypothetical protein